MRQKTRTGVRWPVRALAQLVLIIVALVIFLTVVEGVTSWLLVVEDYHRRIIQL